MSLHPSLPSPSNLFGKYGGSGEYFSTDLVQCDSASWQLFAMVVPALRVAMDTPASASSAQVCFQHLRQQFSSSSIGDELNQNLKCLKVCSIMNVLQFLFVCRVE